MLFDTGFLIHTAGHRGKKSLEAAEQFLAAHQDVTLYTSRICWAEFAEGCSSPAEIETHLQFFTVIEIGESIAWTASHLSRDLRHRGLHIGDNDIWIAATAITFSLPLVSRNARHFGRVPGLQIVNY